MYKAKLLEKTEADGANRVLKNTTIAVLLKYLSNFWRSLEMTLIICKAELKLKWTKCCVFSSAGADNINERDSNNNFFYNQRQKIICACSSFISKRQSKAIKTF